METKIKINKSCEYCSEPFLADISNFSIPPFGGDVDAAICISPDNTIALYAYSSVGEYYGKTKINYCPMCGRKLIERGE